VVISRIFTQLHCDKF